MLTSHFWEAGILLAACLIISAVALWRRWSPPLVASLLIGLAVRALAVYFAYGHTPHDVAVSFQAAGHDVLSGRDPLVSLPRFQWNFLPFSAYLFALEIKTGLPWQVAGKFLPVLSDLFTVVLVGHLVSGKGRQNAQLLYALSPVAIMVSGWHGQVDTIAVALGLSALLLARKQEAVWAGLAVGSAIACKNWPVLFVPGVLRGLQVRRWWSALGAASTILVGWLLVERFALTSGLRHAVKTMLGYRSFAGVWGWSGIVRYVHKTAVGYSGPQVMGVQRVGTILVATAMVATLWLFRRCPPRDLTLALILAFLATTAGFGPQYLVWPAGLLLAARRPAGYVYSALASVYVGFFYLYAFPLGRHFSSWPGLVLELCSLAIVVAALASMPWSALSPAPQADARAMIPVPD